MSLVGGQRYAANKSTKGLTGFADFISPINIDANNYSGVTNISFPYTATNTTFYFVGRGSDARLAKANSIPSAKWLVGGGY